MTFILGGTFLAGLAATHLMLHTGVAGNLALRYGVSVCVAYLIFLALIRLWLYYVGIRDDGGIDFTADAIDLSLDVAASGSWETGSGGGSSFDPASDADELVVVILFLALVAALLFAGIYLIWSAPAILTEAAFEAALVGALARRAKKIDSPGWVGAVSKATALPFLGILVLAMTLGWVVQKACPEATRMRDAFHCAAVRRL